MTISDLKNFSLNPCLSLYQDNWSFILTPPRRKHVLKCFKLRTTKNMTGGIAPKLAHSLLGYDISKTNFYKPGWPITRKQRNRNKFEQNVFPLETTKKTFLRLVFLTRYLKLNHKLKSTLLATVKSKLSLTLLTQNTVTKGPRCPRL